MEQRKHLLTPLKHDVTIRLFRQFGDRASSDPLLLRYRTVSRGERAKKRKMDQHHALSTKSDLLSSLLCTPLLSLMVPC